MDLFLKKCSSKKAFSLIELVLAIVVVGIIAIPLSLLFSQHFETVVASAQHAKALNLARCEMEVVNNLDYAGIVTDTFSNYQGYSLDVDRTVTYAYGDAMSEESLKLVVVDVKEGGSPDILESLKTYFSKNVNYDL